ncbi:MAG TPA: hypothetical protein VN522_07080 [Solirubrobacterales bacterium]|nr:hypothetical protein [Solirubrobacterales bacterium]
MRRRFSVGSLILVIAVCLGLIAFSGPVGAAPPVVAMGTATNVTYTTVDVTGTVNPEGEEGSWVFEVSTDGGANWEPRLGGSFGEPVQGTLEGLRPGTAYKVRLTARNFTENEDIHSAGTADFTTETLPNPTVTLDPITGPTDTTAHLVGHINPNAPGNPAPAISTVHYHFQCAPISCPGAEDEKEVPAGSTSVEVTADAVRLEANSTYEVTLVTRNDGGGEVTAGPVSFTTQAGAPGVTTLSAFPLAGATSALLGGRVNPRNSATTWWVEYGPTATYGQSTQPVAAGSGGVSKLVSRQISGLAPGSTYHFRLVAEGAGVTIQGEDVAITMPVPAGPESCANAQYRIGASAALPDCRAYELASPPDAAVSTWSLLDNSADRLLAPWSAVAADGSAVLWRATTPVPGVPGSAGLFDTYRSVRSGGSWHSEYVGIPNQLASSRPPDLQFASSGTDRLLWLTFNVSADPDHDPVPLPSETDITNAFKYRDLHILDEDGSITRVNRGSVHVPASGEEAVFVGASKDLSKVLFTDFRQLVPGAPADPPFPTLYWTDGQTTKLVSKDETGTPITLNFDYAGLSADGSTAVFTSEAGRTLNIWSADSDTTTRAFGPVPENEPTGDLLVDSISTDGHLVFFTTRVSLSADDTDTSRDLYQYDTSTHQSTLISAPSGGSPSGNSDACAAPLPTPGNQKCDILPVIESADGSQAYFVSPEQIVPGRGVDGGVNLFRVAAGEVHFVATLDPSDPVFSGTRAPGGDLVSSTRTRQARLTPDGSKLVFQSRAALTGYDNAGFMEIYLYDPASGDVVCASCRADGAPPTADSSLFTYEGGASGVIGGFYKLYSANADTHGDRVFFNSRDAIVPQDINGKNDVYEYTVASGAAALISSGRGTTDSAYAGSGMDGRDVFIFTADSLVPQDQNGAVFKVYDAREGGGFPPPPAPPASCEGDGCHGARSAASAIPGPASSNLDGAGNPAPQRITCRKGTQKVRRHGTVRCVKSEKNHHHKRDAKHGGRAGR